MWLRSTRLPVLFAWIIILSVVGFVVTHPSTLAPLASRLLSRHLLQDVDGRVRLRDFRVRPEGGVDLYDVSLTLRGERGAVTLVAVDTLEVDYRWGEVLSFDRRFRRIGANGVEIFALTGEPDLEREKGPPDLSGLPRLRIDLLDVDNAALEISGADGRLRERVSHFDWRGELALDDSVVVVTRLANAAWDTRESRLDWVHGRVVVDEKGVHTDRLRVRLNDAPLEAAGERRWNGDLDLRLDGRGTSTGEVENLLGTSLTVVARGDLVGTLTARDDTIAIEGVFSGDFEDYRMEGLDALAVVTPDSVRLPRATGRINGAWFEGHGAFAIGREDRLPFVLEGKVADVNLQSGLIPGEEDLPETDGRGWLRIARSDTSDAIRVRGGLRDGHIAPLPFDTCFVDVTAQEGSVEFHRIQLNYRSLNGTLTGRADSNEVFVGSLEAEIGNIADAPELWNWPEATGVLQAQGQLSGRPDSLVYRGWVAGRRLALRDVEVGTSQAALLVDDVLGEPVFTLAADGEDLTVGGVPLGAYLVWGAISSRGARVDSFIAVRGDTAIALAGHVAFADSVRRIHVERFGIDLEGSRWQLVHPADIEVSKTLLAVPGIEFTSERGSMVVQGLYEKDRVAAGSLELRRFELGLLNPLLGTGDMLSGEATAEVVVAGTPAAPVVDLEAAVTGADFAMARVETLQVSGSYSGGAVQLRELNLVTNRGRVRGRGRLANPAAPLARFWPGADLDLDLEVDEGDWEFFAPLEIEALDRLAGRFAGQFHVGGTTDDPLILGDLVSAPFHIHWAHMDSLRGEILVDRDAMIFSRLVGRKGTLPFQGRLEMPLRFSLVEEPTIPEDGPFFARVRVPENTDLTSLATATNAFLEFSGRGSLDLEVSGPLIHPLYSGSFALEDGGFVLRRQGEIYHECTARGTFAGDELTIEELRGREGLKGTFDGRGRVLFQGLALQTFDLEAKIDRFLVASIPELRVVVNSPAIGLEGARVGPDSLLVPRFTGDLEVVKARYIGDFSQQGGVGNGDPRRGTVAPRWLAELRLQGGPRSARIINRAMELYLSGDVTLVRDIDGMDLRGALTIDSGRLPVFNNDFAVDRGELDFSRAVGIVPYADLDASTRVRLRSKYSNTSIIEQVTVHVRGFIDEPEISYTSESGYSREGVERMLLGLSPQPSDDDADRLRNTSIAAGFNLVEREIAQELEIVDTFEIDQIDRQAEDGSRGFDPLIGVGKYLGQDLYIKYAQGLNQNDRDLLIEYQISDHLLLQSELRRRLDEFQGEDTYNFDLKYRIEY